MKLANVMGGISLLLVVRSVCEVYPSGDMTMSGELGIRQLVLCARQQSCHTSSAGKMINVIVHPGAAYLF